MAVDDYLPLPPLTGSGPALVVGRAPGWTMEYKSAMGLFPSAAVFAVNAIGLVIPCDYWVSLHPEGLFHLPAIGPAMKFTDKRFYGREGEAEGAIPWPLATGGHPGSSALVATLISLVMGFSPVVLVGVHLDSGGHPGGGSYHFYQDGWNYRIEELRGRVFSMAPVGSFTRELLGTVKNG